MRGSTKRGTRALAQAAVAVVALASVSTFAASPWKLEHSPNAPGQADLTGVSCASPSFCIAVGQSGEGTLAESWDGHLWTLASTPKLGGVNFLTDVDCVSPNSCMAVGDVGTSNLVERWDGTGWQVTSGPPGPFTMRKLACSRSGLCVAIGNTEAGAVLSVWSGGAWTVYRLSREWLVSDVACASRALCVAVGATYKAPYAATWNGVRWSRSNTCCAAQRPLLGRLVLVDLGMHGGWGRADPARERGDRRRVDRTPLVECADAQSEARHGDGVRHHLRGTTRLRRRRRGRLPFHGDRPSCLCLGREVLACRRDAAPLGWWSIRRGDADPWVRRGGGRTRIERSQNAHRAALSWRLLRGDLQLGHGVPAGPRCHPVSVGRTRPSSKTSKAVFGELWPRSARRKRNSDGSPRIVRQWRQHPTRRRRQVRPVLMT